MREIKFRVWHKRYKQIFPIREIVWGYYDNQNELIEVNIDHREGFFDLAKEGITSPLNTHYEPAKTIDIELMQYTGLKDKNSKEIYEGDYLKQEGLEVEVKWSEFDAGFVFEDESGSQMIVTSGNSDQWEVTGNIYENPELIDNQIEKK